jgi:cell division protein FtsZ
MKQADEGIEALQKVVDTLIIIPNQNLFRLANENTTFTEAFAWADDVLYQGVKGVTDLMVRPGLINLDFADVRAVMDEMGKAMMGTGEAEGDNRAVEAAEKAIANPLLDEISLEGARGVLINITGGYDLTLFELDEAANKIREKVDPEANIIIGSTLDPSMAGRMRVSVVATGIDAAVKKADMPVPRRSMSQPLRERVSQEVTPAPTFAPVAARQVEAAPYVAQSPVHTPAAYAPAAHAPAPAPMQRAPEPTLFDEPEYDEVVDDSQYADDDALPPPAYQPRPEPAMEVRPESFVAPRAPAPGTPSPEALARLRAAVQQGSDIRRPVAEPVAPPRAAETERPRFGIGSFINRMSGGQSEAPAAPRQQPRVNTHPADAETDPDQERIEIPAFLRRQAN